MKLLEVDQELICDAYSRASMALKAIEGLRLKGRAGHMLRPWFQLRPNALVKKS